MPRYYFNPGVTGPRFMGTSWNAGQGGVMPGMVHAPPSSLGNADLIEAGLYDPIYEPYPALRAARARLCKLPQSAPCNLRANAAAAMNAVGAEEDLGAIPIWSGLSTNEKTLAVIGAGALAWWWMRSSRRGGRRGRRNPWAVTARSRGVTGTIHFTSKKLANEYAGYLRKAKKRARVKHTRK